MVVDSRKNRQQLEGWKDRTMFDRRAAAAPGWPAYEPGGWGAAQEPPRELSIPEFNSKPGAPVALYLDFNGPCEAGEHIQVDVFDGGYEPSARQSVEATSPDAFDKSTSIEVRVIREIWQAIAEKLAHVNVNVTTVRPDECADVKARRVAVGRLYQECYRSMLQYR
jgi:hypothetical protein